MVPVARSWVGAVWLPVQSPKKNPLNGSCDDSVISKLPGPNVTNWLPDPPVKEKDGG